MHFQSKSELKYHRALSKLFDKQDHTLFTKIIETGTLTYCNTGELLFKQGDEKNTLCIVLSGRLRVFLEKEEGLIVLGDITEGEPVGEFAFFAKEPRSASVFAMRPSVILELDEAAYIHILSLEPNFAINLTAILLRRVQENNLEKHLEKQTKNIAIIQLQKDLDLTPWSDLVEQEFKKTGALYSIHKIGDQLIEDINTLFSTLEENDGINFFICDESDISWSKQCLVYSDLVIVATDFHGSPDLYPIEKTLELYHHHFLNKKIYLLLLHPVAATAPKNTQKWFSHRKINLHIHFRNGHSKDAARFCRIITNKAVGLVLGGGGSKGFAHIGAVKAMLHAGIPIDFLGGTSAGALYGFGMVLCDFDIHKMDFHAEESAKKKLIRNDFTLPMLSIMSGDKFKNYLKFLFGDTCLEDFWISTYCVSANYSSAAITVHETGLAWKKIQASIAIPGIFPPVLISNQLHVDGGVVDNLPVEPMYRFPVGNIVAIALSSVTPYTTDLDEIPSSWTLLWDKVTGKKKYSLPGLSSILINSLMLNSVQRQEQHKFGVTLYIELNLKGIGLLDDKKWQYTIQQGYDQMENFLQNVDPRKKFW